MFQKLSSLLIATISLTPSTGATIVRAGTNSLVNGLCSYCESSEPNLPACYPVRDPFYSSNIPQDTVTFGCVPGPHLGNDSACDPCSGYTCNPNMREDEGKGPNLDGSTTPCGEQQVCGCSPHITFVANSFNCLSITGYDVPVTVYETGTCGGKNWKITAGGEYDTKSHGFAAGHCVTIDC